MASGRSRVMNVLTRLAMWVIFRRPEKITLHRATMLALDQKQKLRLPPGVTMEDVAEPIAGRWLRTSSANKQVILYLHGGAFIMRLPNGHTTMVASFCADSQCQAFMPWYRLAPEHPLPAAPDDCLAAYRMLLDSGHAPRDIVVMGDSAGGNLALVLLHRIKAAGLPMPAGAIALSPITDFAQISASWRMNTWRDPMYRVQRFVNPVEHYLDGANPIAPEVSPYYGDFSGFPPIHLLVGGVEALLDDSVGMARKAIENQVPAHLQIWQGMPHVFVLQDFLPETKFAKREIAKWLRNLCESAPNSIPLYRSCVEFFDLQMFTGQLRRTTNDRYLMIPPIPLEQAE